MSPRTSRAVRIGGYAFGAAVLLGLFYLMVIFWFFWLAGPFDFSFMETGEAPPGRRTSDLLAAMAATIVMVVAIFCAVRLYRLERRREA